MAFQDFPHFSQRAIKRTVSLTQRFSSGVSQKNRSLHMVLGVSADLIHDIGWNGGQRVRLFWGTGADHGRARIVPSDGEPGASRLVRRKHQTAHRALKFTWSTYPPMANIEQHHAKRCPARIVDGTIEFDLPADFYRPARGSPSSPRSIEAARVKNDAVFARAIGRDEFQNADTNDVIEVSRRAARRPPGPGRDVTADLMGDPKRE